MVPKVNERPLSVFARGVLFVNSGYGLVVPKVSGRPLSVFARGAPACVCATRVIYTKPSPPNITYIHILYISFV